MRYKMVLWCTVALAALLVAVPPVATSAELYLMLNVGDTEDREAVDAGFTLDKALDGKQPKRIDDGAERYFVLMPEGATINTFDGNATKVGEKAVEPVPTGAVSADMEAASSASEDQGDTGWIELRASVVSLFYFSPVGEGESSWRREPARLFVRRFEDGRVVVMIGGRDVSPPVV